MLIRLILGTIFMVIISSNPAFPGSVSSVETSTEGGDSPDAEQLLNIYGSVEYFFDTNPAAISIRTIQIRGVSPGSHGYDLYGDVSSRAFKPLDKLGFGLGFSYSSTFFVRQEARSLDSAVYNPYVNISFTPLPTLEFTLRGDISFNYFDRNRISNDYGGTLTGTWYSEGGQSLNIHGGLRKERFSDAFNDRAGGSLRYQDAWNRSLGLGGYLFEPESNISLNLDYTFTDHRTYMDPRFRGLSRKARDSRYSEHAAYGALSVPLKGVMSRFSLDGSVSYAYRDHLNRQSGLLYPSVRRQFMKVIVLTLDGRLNAVLWEPAGLTLSLGISETTSRSHSRESNYVETRYYAQLSAYY